jgi:quercetin dioxygenase-like cupin family protein
MAADGLLLGPGEGEVLSPLPERAQFLNIHAPGTGFAESTATFDPPASAAVVRGPGDGDPLTAGTSEILFKAGHDDGDGTLMLAEARLAPNAPGPPLHRHDRHIDSFYVVEGNLTLWLGEDEYAAGPGSYGVVPPGQPHTFANRSDAPVLVLYVIAPGGFERYMKELWTSTPPGEAPDPALIAELSTRHDIRPA